MYLAAFKTKGLGGWLIRGHSKFSGYLTTWTLFTALSGNRTIMVRTFVASPHELIWLKEYERESLGHNHVSEP